MDLQRSLDPGMANDVRLRDSSGLQIHQTRKTPLVPDSGYSNESNVCCPCWGNYTLIQMFFCSVVSQTPVQTSTQSVAKKKRCCMRLSVVGSFSPITSSRATLQCPLRLSWLTASMTCASMTACRLRSVTTWRHMLRPVRVPVSPSAGETAAFAVSYSNKDSHKYLNLLFVLPHSRRSLQPCPVLLTATTQTAQPPALPRALTSSLSSAICLQLLVSRAASAMLVTSSVTASVLLWTSVAVWTQTESTMM